MSNEQFEKIINEQIDRCKTLLSSKGDEYDNKTQNKFHCFDVASKLLGMTPHQALAGMMVKHTVSIYDMCKSGEYTVEQWSEKITDHINYLLILRAMIEEQKGKDIK